ncbi:PepSY domain-containing protein [Duganella sp. FT135W]|uniref:PepSY domain-containing protein n=1 Tax=Duganella flavida TaxID=2692175 RepID=A0A6L8KCB1_9BURK|nr:PepSY-associated TM helix domain-containing protein [Duganella flavida]MYM22071.1 PepSY domain-containing protein [Duganella flavida]
MKRIAIIIVGAYLFASIGAALLSALNGPGSDAMLGGALLGLALYAPLVVWGFGTRRGSSIKGGLRQRMAWLHTWAGLWVCWLAFAIFLTGTLSVFVHPISDWMRPEQAQEISQAPFTEPLDHALQLKHGLRYLAQHAPNSKMWELWPRAGADEFQVFWLNEKGYYADAHLSTATGAAMKEEASAVRDTLGGMHFVEFHHALHAGTTGLWIVGLASAAMLVALISGVITHKRIFQDFFTFRPAKGQRSWLDAHNLAGVLALPFLFMIVYSGLAISWSTYMPAVSWAQELRTGETAHVREYGPESKPSGRSGALASLDPLVHLAETTFHTPAYAVVVNHPGDAAMTVQVYSTTSPDTQEGNLLSKRGMMKFDGVSGALLETEMPHRAPPNGARATMATLDELHRLHFAGSVIRWIYFVAGMAGTAMMATGAILFMVKRRQKSLNEFGSATARVYRAIDALNVASIAGLSLACIGFLWSNRLLPLDLQERHEWEVGAFFLLWLASLLHATMRPVARAWREQLWAGAALCLLLPALNAATTGQHLLGYLAHGDTERAAVELTAAGLGLVLAFAALRTGQRKAATVGITGEAA